MSIEMLTYAALGARLTVSPEAARSLAKRRRLPRSLSDDGKALVSVDLAEIRHTPRPPGRREAGDVALAAKFVALQAEIARLEGFLRTDGRTPGSIDSHGLAARRPGHLAADLVAGDRKAFREQSMSSHSQLAGEIVRQK